MNLRFTGGHELDSFWECCRPPTSMAYRMPPEELGAEAARRGGRVAADSCGATRRDCPAQRRTWPAEYQTQWHGQGDGGEASDSRNFEILLDLGPDIAPRAAITDKGYDAKANRDGARRRGICPVIPFKSNAIDKPAFFPKILYKARARIEQVVGKLKRFKRIALRCEKTAQNYGSFVALAFGFILVKSVHTA